MAIACVTSALPASSPTSLTSLLTNLLYQPPHQPPYQPSHQPLPLAISRWNTRLRIMYIYGTYIPPLERASLSLLPILSSSHQAQIIITKPLTAPSSDLSLTFPIFSTCAALLSTAPLLPLPYCNPSCYPLASSLLQFSFLMSNMACLHSLFLVLESKCINQSINRCILSLSLYSLACPCAIPMP